MAEGEFMFVKSGIKIIPTARALSDFLLSWENGLRSSSVLIELTTTDRITLTKLMASPVNVGGLLQRNNEQTREGKLHES